MPRSITFARFSRPWLNLGKFANAAPFAHQLPNYRELVAELAALEAAYPGILEGESTPRSAAYMAKVREAEERDARLADLFRSLQ